MAAEQPEDRQEAADMAQGAEEEPSAEQRLMEAAAAGNGPLVAQLLREGAEPACETEEGITPLMLAAESGSAEAVQALLGALLGRPASMDCAVLPLLCPCCFACEERVHNSHGLGLCSYCRERAVCQCCRCSRIPPTPHSCCTGCRGGGAVARTGSGRPHSWGVCQRRQAAAHPAAAAGLGCAGRAAAG